MEVVFYLPILIQGIFEDAACSILFFISLVVEAAALLLVRALHQLNWDLTLFSPPLNSGSFNIDVLDSQSAAFQPGIF